MYELRKSSPCLLICGLKSTEWGKTVVGKSAAGLNKEKGERKKMEMSSGSVRRDKHHRSEEGLEN